ncbi:MAG TPA: IS110 family transposase, partial [Gammaproteobacteria bacterium]|nr:IS110 family transposase [Gammaproteobacteria bacterium]
MMKILALDLGKYKTVGCAYESESGAHQFKRGLTTVAGLAGMVQEVKPDRVVIEICSIAGWVCDLMWGLGVELQVANTSDDAWRWRKVKQKDDRRDALKAARLSAVNQIREVYVPAIEVRQWRALITYRQPLVRRRTKIKNHIRDLLLREGQLLGRGSSCWSEAGLKQLGEQARPFSECGPAELWRGELQVELEQLQEMQRQVATVTAQLNKRGAGEARVQLLRTVPGVGARLAEAIVALLDQPQRFRKGSQVSGYIGMVPKALDSGETERRGHITRQGSRVVR